MLSLPILLMSYIFGQEEVLVYVAAVITFLIVSLSIFGEGMALKLVNAKRLALNERSEYSEIARNLIAKHKMKSVFLYEYEGDEVNALVVGSVFRNNSIAVSKKALDEMSYDELELFVYMCLRKQHDNINIAVETSLGMFVYFLHQMIRLPFIPISSIERVLITKNYIAQIPFIIEILLYPVRIRLDSMFFSTMKSVSYDMDPELVKSIFCRVEESKKYSSLKKDPMNLCKLIVYGRDLMNVTAN